MSQKTCDTIDTDTAEGNYLDDIDKLITYQVYIYNSQSRQAKQFTEYIEFTHIGLH